MIAAGLFSKIISNPTLVFLIVACLGGLLCLFNSSGKGKEEEEPEVCDVCSDKEVIIYFKDNARDFRYKADYCPKCGRELYKK